MPFVSSSAEHNSKRAAINKPCVRYNYKFRQAQTQGSTASLIKNTPTFLPVRLFSSMLSLDFVSDPILHRRTVSSAGKSERARGDVCERITRTYAVHINHWHCSPVQLFFLIMHTHTHRTVLIEKNRHVWTWRSLLNRHSKLLVLYGLTNVENCD